MTSQGSVHGQFQKALQRGNALHAFALAHELPHVTLSDALELTLLLAGDDRYAKASVRWIGRYALETEGIGLTDVQLAASALGAAPHSSIARETLRGLCVHEEK